MKSIQENYKLYKEGKINTSFLKKQILQTYPNRFTTFNSLNEMISSLKSKGIINEENKKSTKKVNLFETFKKNLTESSYDEPLPKDHKPWGLIDSYINMLYYSKKDKNDPGSEITRKEFKSLLPYYEKIDYNGRSTHYRLKEKFRSNINESKNSDTIKKELEKLASKYGVKVKVIKSTNNIRPIKSISKPINAPDEFYDEFNKIIDLYGLKDVIKSSINESKKDQNWKETKKNGIETTPIEQNFEKEFSQRFFKGFYAEMNDEKNKDKDVDELKKLVAKNLAKDESYYTKNSAFGSKEIGYEQLDSPYEDEVTEVKSLKESLNPKLKKSLKQLLGEGIHDIDITSASHTNAGKRNISDVEDMIRSFAYNRKLNPILKKYNVKIEDFIKMVETDQLTQNELWDFDYIEDRIETHLSLNESLNPKLKKSLLKEGFITTSQLKEYDEEDKSTGLNFYPEETEDMDEMINALKNSHLYGEDMGDLIFFEEEPENYDALEQEIQELMNSFDINGSIGGVFMEENINENALENLNDDYKRKLLNQYLPNSTDEEIEEFMSINLEDLPQDVLKQIFNHKIITSDKNKQNIISDVLDEKNIGYLKLDDKILIDVQDRNQLNDLITNIGELTGKNWREFIRELY